MTLKEIRDAYEEGSTVVNQFNLKLLYAGIAIVWLLKGGQNSSIVGIPKLLLGALFCFCLSLLLHMIQAYVHTKIWYRYYSQQKAQKQDTLAMDLKEKALDEETVLVDEREDQSKITWCFWHVKPIITTFGYLLIGIYLVCQLNLNNDNSSQESNNGIASQEHMYIEKCLLNSTLLQAIKSNQDSIIKILQPKPEVKKVTTSKKVAKKNSSKAKTQPLYLPLDTITCDGKEYMIVEKVK